MREPPSIGIIGGNGMLGSAIARALLNTGTTSPERLWIASRSGDIGAFEDWPGVQFATDNQALVDACPVVLLSIPPAEMPALGVRAEDRLLISVMAGISVAQIESQTGACRIVRAMSSPAASIGRAYSPWIASAAVTVDDRSVVGMLFEACGLTDEVQREDHIDQFTALTGPVPGFVAFFADCMVTYAVNRGIDPEVADRAIRQLFRASGEVMSESVTKPSEHVREMIEYAGTTAAGLNAMQQAGLNILIEQGLDASYQKARSIR